MAVALQTPLHKERQEFRNYVDSKRQEEVATTYSLNHQHQTVDYVRQMYQEYTKFNVR